MAKLRSLSGADALSVLEGSTFMVSTSTGDVPPLTDGGIFFNDTRFVSEFVVTVNGQPWNVLTSDVVNYFSASMFLTNPGSDDLPEQTLTMQRHRFIGQGLHEDLVIYNHGNAPVDLEIRVAFACDFADLFEVKDSAIEKVGTYATAHDATAGSLHFRYENGPFFAATHITSRQHGEISGDAVVFRCTIDGRASWDTCVEIHFENREGRYSPVRDCNAFVSTEHMAQVVMERWKATVPQFWSSNDGVHDVLRQSVIDLAALRLEAKLGKEVYTVPAAGLPWFMALFGRDTLITSYQTMWINPELGRGALAILAALQGEKFDAFRDEAPGKILHELRYGEQSVLGIKPQSPYYGSVDATILWLVLYSQYWRMTADAAFILSLKDHALRALEWIATTGDPNHDGYVSYGTQSTAGLGNQGWKDSGDSIRFHDGTFASHPIALSEVQGYVYDAKIRLAEIAEIVWKDVSLAQKLRREAEFLKDQFNRDYWVDRQGGFYALALDGDHRQVDSMTSNMGQLLWSGIVPDERAKIVAHQLMSKEMFSGWGIRTMSTRDVAYNPIAYHNGTVWPHDNSLICAGLLRYGCIPEAQEIASVLFAAATYTRNRLPETFAGYPRVMSQIPVRYPSACSPQAWATGSPIFMLWSLLGLSANGAPHLECAPNLPDSFGTVIIDGVHHHGKRYRIEAKGTHATVARSEEQHSMFGNG